MDSMVLHLSSKFWPKYVIYNTVRLTLQNDNLFLPSLDKCRRYIRLLNNLSWKIGCRCWFGTVMRGCENKMLSKQSYWCIFLNLESELYLNGVKTIGWLHLYHQDGRLLKPFNSKHDQSPCSRVLRCGKGSGEIGSFNKLNL